MKYEPRTVYVISFDVANTDLKYFCSHADQVLDGVADSDIFYGDIINASTNSQGLNPIRANATIGNINFTFKDTGQSLSSLLNSKLSAGDGLKAKRVQHWLGEKGAEWTSGYTLVQTHQINDSIRVVNNGQAYQFTGVDIQRSQLENIFTPKKTNTTAALTKTGITVNVGSTSGIELIQHGSSYSDAPNVKVLYFRIGDEIIRGTSKTTTTFTVDNAQSTLTGAVAKDAVSIVVADASGFDSSGVGYIDDGISTLLEIKWTGKSSNTLTGVTGVTTSQAIGWTIVASNGRGALGTVPAAYDYQAGSDRVKVVEHIYYELPAIKLAYAILTGTLYGSADTIPEHHTLGISTDWISTSQFIQFSDDIWDSTDDTKGVIFRFSGLEKTNAKKFIEEELYFWCGVFSPILNTGELGLKRMTGVISDAAYVVEWNEANVVSINNVRFDLNDIHNNVSIDWNYDPISKIYTRPITLSDSDSFGKWGLSKTLELKSKGLHGSIQTDAVIGGMFNAMRDRHVGPPFKATVTLDYSQRGVKVGDIVRLNITHIPEFTDQGGAFSSFDSSVEIQKINFNPSIGTITCDVFGSTQKSTPLLLGRTDASPLADAWFTSEGTDISTVTTSTVSGGILTITAGSLVGHDDLSSASAKSDNSTGIFYWDGPVNVNGQIDITKNVEIRANGFVTFNSAGKINGKGRGLAGGTTGIAGAIGNTQAGGGYTASASGQVGVGISSMSQAELITGVNAKAPQSLMVNVSGNELSNTPRNQQGSSGGKGKDVITHRDQSTFTAVGGAGGNGGAGFALYCKGASGVAGTSIDLSGDDGIVGAAESIGGETLNSGTGAGGASGIFSLFLIGNTVVETLSGFFTALNGATDIVGVQMYARSISGLRYNEPQNFPTYSFYTGIGTRDVSRANLLVDWVPDNITVTPDVIEIADTPSVITFTENVNTPQTPAENLATIDVAVTPPSDTSYSHSMISYKLTTDADTQYQRLPYPAKDETTVTIPMDGLEYSFRAYPVNVDGVESTDFIQKNFTVSTAKGGVELATGNYIRTNPDPAANGGLLVQKTGLFAYDSGGNLLTEIDEGTGELILKSDNTGKRIEINPSGDNEIHFYGDRGDGTVEELATIGIRSSGADGVLGWFGTTSSDNIAINAQSKNATSGTIKASNSLAAGWAISGIGGAYGVWGRSVLSGADGVYGLNDRSSAHDGAGVSGQSNYGYSVRCVHRTTQRAPIVIEPSTSSSAPAHLAEKGSLWVTSAGVLYINTSGSTTWAKVGAQ